jgi:branched-chain amino acid transport system substrate-binding protein
MKLKRLLGIALLVAMTSAMSLSFVRAQDNVIKIASQSPLSGPQSVLGIGIRNAVELAIEQLGGPLTEAGYTIEFVPFDDQATAEVGVANAQQIVNDAAILAVIGHLNSGVAIPSSEVYNANDLAMVSPANTNPLVTDRGFPTVNRVCGRDDLQGPTGARFAAEELGVTSVYVLHDTTAYGQGVAEFFRTEAETIGLTVLGFEGTEETANFDGLIQPILALQPEVIYFGGIYSQTGIFINQARSAGYEGFFMGPDGFDSTEFAELAGEAGVGTYYTSVAGPATIYPNAAQFITDYTERYGEAPQPFGAQAYDSTGVALAGIQAAIEAAGGLPTRAQVAEAIRATEGYEGLTSTITFDDNGDPEVGLYYVIEVLSSDPDEWGNNELLSTLEIPSPLAMMEGEEGMMGTLADIAMGDEDFSTLVAAVLAADPAIVAAITGEGPLTVFAPNNAAFEAALAELGVEAADLLADTELLSAILLYHVVDGAVMSGDLTDGMEVTTLNGGTFTVGIADGTVTLTDARGRTATVVAADIEASNGVIHVIDNVILPAE